MKICVAQIKPISGAIDKNIAEHTKWINCAAQNGADAVFFPELSLTGYEPELARELATTQDDERLDSFQEISDTMKITIGVGLPTTGADGIWISMVIFQPGRARQTYSKQYLHSDELAYFVEGGSR